MRKMTAVEYLEKALEIQDIDIKQMSVFFENAKKLESEQLKSANLQCKKCQIKNLKNETS